MSVFLQRAGLLSSGVAAFTPADLFAAGEAGAWYDPSDLSTLWKDTAGTDPVTADGDVVARIDDKSGNGNHATHGTASRRPLYKTSGGLHWLQGDGFDDTLFVGEASYPDMTQPTTVALGGKYDNAESGAMHYMGGNSTNAADRNTIYRSGTDERFYAGTAVTYATADTNSHTYLAEFNGASSFIRRDGVEFTGNPGTGALKDLAIVSWRNGAAGPLGGRLYQCVVIDRALTSEEIADTETFLSDKSGVTL